MVSLGKNDQGVANGLSLAERRTKCLMALVQFEFALLLSKEERYWVGLFQILLLSLEVDDLYSPEELQL